MPCYYPLDGYMSKKLSENGKQTVVFSHRDGWNDQKIRVPCGKCIGCRLERSRQWALRCTNEASLYEDNCFITLTYSDDNCPKSLNVDDFQKFIKRLRKNFREKKIRYFACGEYGDKLGRPHYHACLFNVDFSDKKIIAQKDLGSVYSSETLEKIWNKGHVQLGQLDLGHAQYVAQYTIKKVSGKDSEKHYQGRKPEFGLMSLKPAIGTDWLKKYKSDVYPHDYVVNVKGIKGKPPKIYDKILDTIDSNMLLKVKSQRREQNVKTQYSDERRSGRLHVKAQVKKAQLKSQQRSI